MRRVLCAHGPHNNSQSRLSTRTERKQSYHQHEIQLKRGQNSFHRGHRRNSSCSTYRYGQRQWVSSDTPNGMEKLEPVSQRRGPRSYGAYNGGNGEAEPYGSPRLPNVSKLLNCVELDQTSNCSLTSTECYICLAQIFV